MYSNIFMNVYVLMLIKIIYVPNASSSSWCCSCSFVSCVMTTDNKDCGEADGLEGTDL